MRVWRADSFRLRRLRIMHLLAGPSASGLATMTARKWSPRRTQSAQTLSCRLGLALVQRGAVCRQLLYEAGLMDLARRRARELCRRAKSEPRRHLVACQPLPAEGDDRRGIGRRPGPQLDHCGDELALRPIRNAPDLGLPEVPML